MHVPTLGLMCRWKSVLNKPSECCEVVSRYAFEQGRVKAQFNLAVMYKEWKRHWIE